MADKPVKSVITKKVNIIAPIPIRTVNPTIFGRYEGISMTPANILKCLIGRATVHEVLSDGSLLKLNDRNYNKVNTPPVKYPEHKEIAKQKSAVGKNSFSRKKPKANQSGEMSKDLKNFVDSKFIPESTNPEKTFRAAPEVTGDETQTLKEAIAESTPGYLKDIDGTTKKEFISDDAVAAAQVAAKEMLQNTGDTASEEDPAAHPGPDGGNKVVLLNVTDQPSDKEAKECAKHIYDPEEEKVTTPIDLSKDAELLMMIRDELKDVKYDFGAPIDESKWRAEAKRLLMEIGGYSEDLAENMSANMIIVQPDEEPKEEE